MMRTVEVHFGETTKRLKFDFNAMYEIEESMGKGISAILKEDQIGFRMIQVFYYAGLKHGKDRGITLDNVGQLLTSKIQDEECSFEDLMQPILKALDKSGLFGKGVKLDPSADYEEEEKNTVGV
ncbi:hypothetical protein VQL36_11580 [Chengkuizengella sp. SCS-71B]|uniref:hypothetical protein n=1 Tax=Chengkuizengella sp. SCS-71B TaxID=3115290 RepID=UPI0032C22BA5